MVDLELFNTPTVKQAWYVNERPEGYHPLVCQESVAQLAWKSDPMVLDSEIVTFPYSLV